MASKKAGKQYPPGQKPSSVTNAKPTMAQAFQSAQGSMTPGPGNVKPTPSYFPKGTATGKASQPKDTRSAAQRIVEAGQASMKPKDSLQDSMDKITGKTPIPAPPGARKGAKAAGIGAPSVTKGKQYPPGQTPERTESKPTKSTAPAAKPYVKLKDASREAARRAYVQKQLDRLGIKPAAAGKPRSAKEKAARAKARATWDKKNPFVPKKKGTGDMGSPSDAARERRPEA